MELFINRVIFGPVLIILIIGFSAAVLLGACRENNYGNKRAKL